MKVIASEARPSISADSGLRLPRRNDIFLLGLLIIWGCAGPQVKKAVPPLSVNKIAILPFDNESVDIDASEVMQKLVYSTLTKSSPYTVLNIEQTNAKLAEKGIIDGGQLPVLDPIKMAEDLGAEALLYGYVEDFKYINVGIYVSRNVSLQVWLVDGKTGETIYEKSGKGTSSTFAVNEEEIKDNFIVGLADQALDKILRSPLKWEAEVAVQKALANLPGFRFRNIPRKEELKRHINKQIYKK